MTVVARIDSQISNLQGLRQIAVADTAGGDFEEALLSTSSETSVLVSEVGELSGLIEPPSEVSSVPAVMPTAQAISFRTMPSFNDYLRSNLLTTAELSRQFRPTSISNFMERTDLSFQDSVEIIYGVIGSNTDLRDWRAIMASDNPVDAARAATRQLYNSDLDYQLGQRPEKGTDAFAEILAERSMVPDETIARAGNFAVVVEPEEDQEPEDAVPFVSAVTSTGLKLREAGGTKEQIERTAWLFGFDLSQVASMAAQTRVRSEHLADVLESLGSSS